MNSAQLTRWLNALPFEPFRIVMTDQVALDIFHPDQVIVSKGTAIVGSRAKANLISERDLTISLLHVVRLEPI